jgi:hypothetical protein
MRRVEYDIIKAQARFKKAGLTYLNAALLAKVEKFTYSFIVPLYDRV